MRKPWELAKDSGKRAELHEVCSEALRAFFKLSIFLKPILPALVAEVEALFDTPNLSWAHIASQPLKVKPYRHLMTRIDAKQIDALFEPSKETPAMTHPETSPVTAPAAPSGRGAVHHRHR